MAAVQAAFDVENNILCLCFCCVFVAARVVCALCTLLYGCLRLGGRTGSMFTCQHGMRLRGNMQNSGNQHPPQ